MPTSEIAEYIPRSLAEGENRDDFDYMFDTLVQMRRAYRHDAEETQIARVAAKLICVLVIAKPPRYIEAMQQYRLIFRGVSENPRLKAEFSNSILPAALVAGSEEDIEFMPSLYFSPFGIRNRPLGIGLIYRDDLRTIERLLPAWF
jgi:hypothetical protein